MKKFDRIVRSLIFLFIVLFIACGSAQAVHWPLRISGSGKYLEDQDGIPFPIIGDAGWDLNVDTMNNTNVQTYLNDRQAKGYTAIMVEAIEHSFSGPYNYNGDYPFTNGESDWSARNEAYWTNVDYILTQAKNRGMVVLLYPAYIGYGCGSEGWCSDMVAQTDAAMTSYGAWIGSRYANQGNIIWVHGGDAAAGAYANALSRVNAVANAISNSIPGSLHTAHSYRERSALDDYRQSWLNINSTYSNCSTYAERIRTDYQRSGALPYVFIEGRYENESDWTQTCIQGQALGAYLGGALLGHIFGNSPVWGFTTGWEGTTGIGSPGSYSMGYIGKLIRSRKWWALVPDYSNVVVTSPKGSGVNYHSTAREENGETVVVWCPNSDEISVDMTKIGGSQADAWWWNPDDNSSSFIGTYNTTGTRNFTPSTSRKVLVLDNKEANLPLPGTTIYSVDKIPPSPPTNVRIISP